MIGGGRQLRIFASTEPTDMRKSFDTLAALVSKSLRRDVLSGELFLFVSRNRKRAKVLYFDGTGMCLLAKRLEKGRFANVHVQGRRSISMTMTELALFIEGSEVVGKRELSPPLLTFADLTPRWRSDANQT